MGYQLTRGRKANGTGACWEKARLSEDAVRQVAFDPADMVKARLPESQSPVVNVRTRRKERLTTGASPCDGHEPEDRRTFAGWTLASEAKQGDEWGT